MKRHYRLSLWIKSLNLYSPSWRAALSCCTSCQCLWYISQEISWNSEYTIKMWLVKIVKLATMPRVQIQHINFWACFSSNMNGKSRTHCLTKWEDKKLGPTYCTNRVAQTCRPCRPVGAIFFWPVLIFGKNTRKTGKNTRKQAKNRRFFGADFFVGKIGRC